MKCQCFLTSVFLITLMMSSFAQRKSIASPVLLKPTNNAELDNGCVNRKDFIEWEFKWSKVPKARRYHLLVSSS